MGENESSLNVCEAIKTQEQAQETSTNQTGVLEQAEKEATAPDQPAQNAPEKTPETEQPAQEPTPKDKQAPKQPTTSPNSSPDENANMQEPATAKGQSESTESSPDEASNGEQDTVEDSSDQNHWDSSDPTGTGEFQDRRDTPESESRSNFIKAVIELILQVSGEISKNIVEVLDKELAAYILEHLEEYPHNDTLVTKLNKRIAYLSEPEHEEKFKILLKDPTVLSKQHVKFQTLLIQRYAFGEEYAKDRTKALFEQNKQFMTKSGYAFKKGKITKKSRVLMSWEDQLNDVATIMALTDEELDNIEGMEGLPGYKKRAILLYAYDKTKKNSHELDKYINAIMGQFKKQRGESKATTAESLKKFCKDWMNDNAVDEVRTEHGEIHEAHATEIQDKVRVKYEVYLYHLYSYGERIRYIPGMSISIKYEILSSEGDVSLEEGRCDPPYDAKTQEDIEKAITEAILDNSIYADQNTELVFQCTTQNSLEDFTHPKLFFHYSITEDGHTEISFQRWKDFIKLQTFDQKEAEQKILEEIKRLYPIDDNRHKIILICDNNDRIVPRRFLDKNDDNPDYKE